MFALYVFEERIFPCQKGDHAVARSNLEGEVANLEEQIPRKKVLITHEKNQEACKPRRRKSMLACLLLPKVK